MGGGPQSSFLEDAKYEKNGPAGIFSFGGVYLEMSYLSRVGCLETLKALGPARDHSFHANLHFQEKVVHGPQSQPSGTILMVLLILHIPTFTKLYILGNFA